MFIDAKHATQVKLCECTFLHKTYLFVYIIFHGKQKKKNCVLQELFHVVSYHQKYFVVVKINAKRKHIHTYVYASMRSMKMNKG